jgi:hypothetical protein
MDFPNFKPTWSLGNRSKSQNAIEMLKKRKMVRFFGGDSDKNPDGSGKSRSGFFVSMLSKYEEGRRSESDLTKRATVRKVRIILEILSTDLPF